MVFDIKNEGYIAILMVKTIKNKAFLMLNTIKNGSFFGHF